MYTLYQNRSLLLLTVSLVFLHACGDEGSDNAETSNAETSNAETSNAGTSNAATSNAATSNAGTSNAGTSNAATSNAISCPEDQMVCGDGCSERITPDFASVYDGVLSKSCGGFSACHANNPAALGFDADTAADFIASTIDVDAAQAPMLKRIAPGDPENSYLIQVMRGPDYPGVALPAGARFMPPGQVICQEKVDIIAEWIRNGALTE